MQLWIMRHGEAEALRGGNDSMRSLTPRGQEQVLASAHWLLGQGIGPVRVVASPYRRARQTAEIVAAVIPALSVEQQDLLTPDNDPRRVTAWLAEQADAQLLLVSHMPLVGQLAAWLEDGVLAGGGFGVAQVQGLELDIAGPAQALRRGRFVPG